VPSGVWCTRRGRKGAPGRGRTTAFLSLIVAVASSEKRGMEGATADGVAGGVGVLGLAKFLGWGEKGGSPHSAALRGE